MKESPEIAFAREYQTVPVPPARPVPSVPGLALSARERGAVDHRHRIERQITSGRQRVSDHVDGFRAGWDAALAYLKMKS